MAFTTLRESLEFYGEEGLLQQLRREKPRDYEDFIDVLYADLDSVIGLMEADAKDLMDASEDFLNRHLVRLLSAKTYIASHDNDEGGHVDIHVKSGNHKYTWLAEAKLDNGPSHINKGLYQLTERYARGTPGHNCGALLIYVQKDRCSDRFNNWKTSLEGQSDDFENFEISSCRRRPGLAFYSEFTLPRIGSMGPKYRIRHMAISLFRTANNTSL